MLLALAPLRWGRTMSARCAEGLGLGHALPDARAVGRDVVTQGDVQVEALRRVGEVQEPGGGAGSLTEVPIRISGKNGAEGAEGGVREVLGKVDLDLVRGRAGIERNGHKRPPR